MQLDDDLELTNFLRKVALMPELNEATFKEIQAKREKMRQATGKASLGRANAAESEKLNGLTGNPNKDAEDEGNKDDNPDDPTKTQEQTQTE
jgi:hypothetical protein